MTLTGVAPSSAGQGRSIRARAVTPKNSEPTVPAGVVVAEGETASCTRLGIYSNIAWNTGLAVPSGERVTIMLPPYRKALCVGSLKDAELAPVF